ncbi:unnamed protein product [Clonostachys rosea]|uniref:Uncharacterized protein n=1 Tax=Bionectria ochroleuca TaxID=29856 RepID=A0ABY6V4A5_BIOOC|nr:unnamed protein product [Clonostachys rosea]
MANKSPLASFGAEPDEEPQMVPRPVANQELPDKIEQLHWKLDIAVRAVIHQEETLEDIREAFNDRWAAESTEWKQSEDGKAFLNSWRIGHEKATKDHEAASKKQQKVENQIRVAQQKLMILQQEV